MKTITRSAEAILFAFLISSCAHTPRQPASLDGRDREVLQSNYITELNKDLKSINQDHSEVFEASENTIRSEATEPTSDIQSFNYNYFELEELITLPDFQTYAQTEANSLSTFLFDPTNTNKYHLRIVNKAFRTRQGTLRDLQGNEFFNATITCDGSPKIHSEQGTDTLKPNQPYEFRIFGKLKEHTPEVSIYPDATTNSCLIRWENPKITPNKFALRLIRETQVISPEIKALRSSFQDCILPQLPDNLTSMQKFFLSADYRQMTCPFSVQSVESLPDTLDGLNSKIEALLGQKLSRADLDRKNPYMTLDFSKAPKLDLIVVSYLVFKSDFYGNMISRLLKWHADHGTQVRILVSRILLSKKDEKMLTKIASQNGNIKMREYFFNAQSKQGTFISQLHRTDHVKLLLTISFSHPEYDFSFVGGRNIHDGFVFKDPPDYSAYPDLINYKGKEESYSYWRDFEARIHDADFTKALAAHFFTLWDQESKSSYVRSWNQNIRSTAALDKNYFARHASTPLLRHYISTPYSENRRIEALFAEMFDHATRKILISTPYFRLSKALTAALQRAVSRGVKITLITRLDLKGDTADFILGDVNKDGVNAFYDKIDIREYTEPNSILHSKLVLIDDEFSMMGSVNLNRRSFIHDLENATLIYSPAYNQELTKIYENYLTQTKPIEKKQKIAFWKRLLIDSFSDKF